VIREDSGALEVGSRSVLDVVVSDRRSAVAGRRSMRMLAKEVMGRSELRGMESVRGRDSPLNELSKTFTE